VPIDVNRAIAPSSPLDTPTYAAEPERLDPRDRVEREAVVHEREVDVGGPQVGAGPQVRRLAEDLGLVGDRLLVPGDPLRDLGADRLDPHGRLGQVGGDRGVGHDDRDQAGVDGQRQRIHHQPAPDRRPADPGQHRPVLEPVAARRRTGGRAPGLAHQVGGVGLARRLEQRQPDVVGRLEPDHDLLANVDLVGVAPDDVGREVDGRVLGERHVGDDVRGLEAGQPPVAVDGERHDGAAARHCRGLPRAAAAGGAHRHRRVDERPAVLALLDPQATVGARGPEPLVGRGELGEWPHRQNVLDRNSTAGVAGGNDPEIPELK
jgi:hypothetical protein